MAKIKRNGKTFITEHYLDDETRAKVYMVATEAMTYLMTYEDFKWYSNELHIWFCPRGIYLARSEKVTINWVDLVNISDELAVDVLSGTMKAFKKYGNECPFTHHFKILLTDGDFADMMRMINL